MTRNVLYADDEPERCAHGKVIPMPDWRKQIEKDVTNFCRGFWIAVGIGITVYALLFAAWIHWRW